MSTKVSLYLSDDGNVHIFREAGNGPIYMEFYNGDSKAWRRDVYLCIIIPPAAYPAILRYLEHLNKVGDEHTWETYLISLRDDPDPR